MKEKSPATPTKRGRNHGKHEKRETRRNRRKRCCEALVHTVKRAGTGEFREFACPDTTSQRDMIRRIRKAKRTKIDLAVLSDCKAPVFRKFLYYVAFCMQEGHAPNQSGEFDDAKKKMSFVLYQWMSYVLRRTRSQDADKVAAINRLVVALLEVVHKPGHYPRKQSHLTQERACKRTFLFDDDDDHLGRAAKMARFA